MAASAASLRAFTPSFSEWRAGLKVGSWVKRIGSLAHTTRPISIGRVYRLHDGLGHPGLMVWWQFWDCADYGEDEEHGRARDKLQAEEYVKPSAEEIEVARKWFAEKTHVEWLSAP